MSVSSMLTKTETGTFITCSTAAKVVLLPWLLKAWLFRHTLDVRPLTQHLLFDHFLKRHLKKKKNFQKTADIRDNQANLWTLDLH